MVPVSNVVLPLGGSRVQPLRRYCLALMVWVVIAGSGCSSADSDRTRRGTPPSSGGSSTNTGGTGGAGSTPVAGLDPTPGPAALPFAVDEFFSPSGYMGDGEVAGHITMTGGVEAACANDRAHADAIGSCHSVDYSPGGQGWAGVYWQSPESNWGNSPGVAIPPGATSVSFYARGIDGAEAVTFMVGGLGGDDTLYADTVEGEMAAILTIEWKQYSILITQEYDGVLGGFGWVTSGADNNGAVSFDLDDIRWVE